MSRLFTLLCVIINAKKLKQRRMIRRQMDKRNAVKERLYYFIIFLESNQGGCDPFIQPLRCTYGYQSYHFSNVPPFLLTLRRQPPGTPIIDSPIALPSNVLIARTPKA